MIVSCGVRTCDSVFFLYTTLEWLGYACLIAVDSACLRGGSTLDADMLVMAKAGATYLMADVLLLK